MGVLDLSAYKPSPNTMGDASAFQSAFDAIVAAVNGIDNNNFAAGHIFDLAKLMQGGAVDGDPLVWNNSGGVWVPGTTKAMRIAALAGYPGSAAKYLAGDGTWPTLPSSLLSLVYDNRLSVDTASWDVQSIPGNPGDDLIVRLVGRGSDAAERAVLVKVNNDATAVNYTNHTVSSGSLVSWNTTVAALFVDGWLPASGAAASVPGTMLMDLPGYAGTDFFKDALVRVAARDTATGQGRHIDAVGEWASTAAITRLTFTPAAGNFKAGSRLTIWRRSIA